MEAMLPPQWEERRLLARANVLVDRDEPYLRHNDPVRAARVDEAVKMLINRRGCNHLGFNHARGRAPM